MTVRMHLSLCELQLVADETIAVLGDRPAQVTWESLRASRISDSLEVMENLPADELLVAVVDDDRDMRTTLVKGLEKFHITCRPFGSGSDFLEALQYFEPDCVLLDLSMPGITGLDVLSAIPEEKSHIPVIIFTSFGSIPAAVSAIRKGAVEFLEKPMSLEQIDAQIRAAIASTSSRSVDARRSAEAKRLLANLTSREAEVVKLVCSGLRSAEIARQLGISARTVEVHRYNAYKKLGTQSSTELMLLLGLELSKNTQREAS